MVDPIVITTSIPLPQLAGMLEHGTDIVLEELTPALMEASLLLERETRELTPTSGAGTLRDSIGALPVTFAGTVISAGIGTALAYALPVETGSKPHMPPIEPLIDWVSRKLGKRGEEGEEIAMAIAWKIYVFGSHGAHMFEKGLAATDAQIRDILAEAADRAAARILQ